MQSTARRALLQHVELMSQYQDFGFQRGRGLKQSHSIRTNKRPIANIRQSCSAFSPCCNSAHSIFGTWRKCCSPNATTWSDALATDCTDQPLGNGPIFVGFSPVWGLSHG